MVNGGNIAAFARFLNLSKHKLWMWQHGKALPELVALLNICHRLQVSLVDFLQKKPLPDTRKLALVCTARNKDKEATLQRKNFDPDLVRICLESYLKEETEAPIPMKELAERIGHPQRVIHRHFPSLCSSVSERYKKYRQSERSRHLKETISRIEEITLQIYDRGEYPTEILVSQFLDKPGVFREKEVREAFHDFRRSLQL